MLLLWFILVVGFFYVFARLTKGICRSPTCLVGKTALITGANSGIGYQTALNLASRGCRIIMADVADMEISKQNIIKATNNANIMTKKLDLSSLQSVRDFAREITEQIDRLDILINNAGVGILPDHSVTDDGLDPVMQINYFGHFLLTHLLIDLLKKSSPSRIVFTSSLFAWLHNLTLENLNYGVKESFYFLGIKAKSYCNSKLAMLIASDIFAEKLKGTGVTSNSIHPGYVSSSIFGSVYDRFLIRGLIIRGLTSIFAKDVWEGSQTLVHVAVAKELEKVSGKYFVDCVSFVKPLCASDRDFCQKIWEDSVKYVGLKPHEMI